MHQKVANKSKGNCVIAIFILYWKKGVTKCDKSNNNKHKNQNKETTLKTFLDFLGGENLFYIKSATRVSRK